MSILTNYCKLEGKKGIFIFKIALKSLRVPKSTNGKCNVSFVSIVIIVSVVCKKETLIKDRVIFGLQKKNKNKNIINNNNKETNKREMSTDKYSGLYLTDMLRVYPRHCGTSILL